MHILRKDHGETEDFVFAISSAWDPLSHPASLVWLLLSCLSLNRHLQKTTSKQPPSLPQSQWVVPSAPVSPIIVLVHTTL